MYSGAGCPQLDVGRALVCYYSLVSLKPPCSCLKWAQPSLCSGSWGAMGPTCTTSPCPAWHLSMRGLSTVPLSLPCVCCIQVLTQRRPFSMLSRCLTLKGKASSRPTCKFLIPLGVFPSLGQSLRGKMIWGGSGWASVPFGTQPSQAASGQ
jgi:hypothetical protein